MENHPIPQDVTGFKFKLIGSITIKEFLYLLGGGILATVVFILPVSFLIKAPLIVLFFGTGAAFAFIPIDGRPMDKMLMNFMKTIPSENEYIYHKKGVSLSAFEFFQPVKALASNLQQNATTDANYKKNLFLAKLNSSSYKPDESESAFMKNIKGFFEDSVVTSQAVMTPIEDQEQKAREKVQPIRVKKFEAEKTQAVQPVTPTISPEEKKTVDTTEAEESLVHAEIVQKSVIKAVQQQHDQSTAQITTPYNATGNVHVVDKDAQLKSGFPTLPDIPNVVLGIIKDPRGKVLPNILVEVVDSNGIPVRAFKTSALGQFAAATPLPNGVYKMMFEDPQKKQEFNIVEITLSGNIFQPLEIISIDQREKLRQELFGGSSPQMSPQQPTAV